MSARVTSRPLREGGADGRLSQMFPQKGHVQRADLVRLFVHGEMTGIDDMGFAVRVVLCELYCAGHHKGRVVAAPYQLHARFILAQPPCHWGYAATLLR